MNVYNSKRKLITEEIKKVETFNQPPPKKKVLMPHPEERAWNRYVSSHTTTCLAAGPTVHKKGDHRCPTTRYATYFLSLHLHSITTTTAIIIIITKTITIATTKTIIIIK